MSEISISKRDGILVCVLDREGSSQNVLNKKFFDELEEIVLNKFYDETPIVFISAKKDFLAGADVSQMAGISREETEKLIKRVDRIFDCLEKRSAPAIAAISGQCLGGGLEFALACALRLATQDAKLGAPEVKLGIIPGFGGTQRLPRLIGLSRATEMIISGKTVDAKKALKFGLIDEIVPKNMMLDCALSLLHGKKMPARKRKRLWLEKLYVLPAARRELAKRVKRAYYPAPFKGLEVLAKTTFLPDYKIEQEAFCNLVVSPQAQNLIRLFLLQQKIKKNWPAQTKIKRTAVIGAGAMGSGIAYALSNAGFPVRLIEKDEKNLLKGLRHITELYEKDVTRKRLSGHEAKRRFDLVSPSPEFSFGETDLVIEAVFEDYLVKQGVLAAIESRVSLEAIIATNTSSLSVGKLSESLKRPQQFLAMHFFNPVEKMPLVEIVPSALTDPVVMREAGALVKQLGKMPILAKDSPGFIVNRVLAHYFFVALSYAQEKINPEIADRVMRDYGMPMGPFELADQVGIDILLHAQKNILPDAPSKLLEEMVAKNFLGKKTGKGFYDWTPAKRIPNPEMGFTPRLAGEERSLIEKLMRGKLETSLIATADQLAGSGTASAEDIELAMVLGAGFPPFRRLAFSKPITAPAH